MTQIRYTGFFMVLDLIIKLFQSQYYHHYQCLPLPTWYHRFSAMSFSLGLFSMIHLLVYFCYITRFLFQCRFGHPKSAISSSTSGNFSRSSVVTCQWCNKKRNTAKKCQKLSKLLKKAKGDGLIEAFTATSVDPSTNSEWYTDIGATSHIKNVVNVFDNSVPYTGSQRVYINNGNSISISWIGEIKSIITSHHLPLSNVLPVASLTKKSFVNKQIYSWEQLLSQFFFLWFFHTWPNNKNGGGNRSM